MAEPPAGASAQTRLLSLLTGVLLIAGLLAVPFTGGQADRIDADSLVAAVRSSGGAAESVAFESVSTFLLAGASGGGVTASGRVASDGAAEVSLRFEGMPVPDYTLISDGNLVVVEVPKENRFRAEGKRWAGAPVGSDGLAALDGFADLGQRQLDRFLSGAHGQVTTVGRDTIRGADTTHYRVRVDGDAVFEELLAAQAGPSGAGTPALAALAGDVEVEVAPVDVWLDDEDRLRRMEIAIAVGAGPVSGRLQVRHDLFDYGVAVTPTLPANDEVFVVDSAATLQSLLVVEPTR